MSRVFKVSSLGERLDSQTDPARKRRPSGVPQTGVQVEKGSPELVNEIWDPAQGCVLLSLDVSQLRPDIRGVEGEGIS